MVFCMSMDLDKLSSVQTTTLAKLVAVHRGNCHPRQFLPFRNVQIVSEDLLCCLCAKYERVNSLIQNPLNSFPKYTGV